MRVMSRKRKRRGKKKWLSNSQLLKLLQDLGDVFMMGLFQKSKNLCGQKNQASAEKIW
jgi:hypothetical protein